jgi:hypothetical protein
VALPAFIIVDSPDQSSVKQTGQPATQCGAFPIDVPLASGDVTTPTAADLDAAVEAWINANSVPTSSSVYAAWAANTGVAGLSYVVSYSFGMTVERS